MPIVSSEGARIAGLTFALSLLMALLDRQGFFLSVAAGIVLLLSSVFARTRRPAVSIRALFAAGGCAGAVLLDMAYNDWIAPAAIQALNGYRPDTSYQELPYLEIFWAPRFLLSGLIALGEQGSFFLGNLGALVVLVLVLAGTLSIAFDRRPARLFAPAETGAIALTILALWVVLYALMILRHPALLWEDVKRFYYGLPLLAFLIFWATLALDRAAALLGERRRRLLDLLLAGLIASNLAALPSHRRVLEEGHLKNSESSSRELLRVLRERSFEPIPAWMNADTRAIVEHYAKVLPRR